MGFVWPEITKFHQHSMSDRRMYTTPEGIDHPNTFVTELNNNDVLMGRGSPSSEYTGNLRLRALVIQRRQEYLTCTKRSEKQQIAVEIIQEVHQRGGRFLQSITNMEEAKQFGVPPGVQAWKIIPASSPLLIKVKQLMRDVGEETQRKRKIRREAKRMVSRQQSFVGEVNRVSDTKEISATKPSGSRTSTTATTPDVPKGEGRSVKPSSIKSANSVQSFKSYPSTASGFTSNHTSESEQQDSAQFVAPQIGSSGANVTSRVSPLPTMTQQPNGELLHALLQLQQERVSSSPATPVAQEQNFCAQPRGESLSVASVLLAFQRVAPMATHQLLPTFPLQQVAARPQLSSSLEELLRNVLSQHASPHQHPFHVHLPLTHRQGQANTTLQPPLLEELVRNALSQPQYPQHEQHPPSTHAETTAGNGGGNQNHQVLATILQLVLQQQQQQDQSFPPCPSY